MGYYYSGEVENNEPKDTPTKMYLYGEYNLEDLLEAAKLHFGEDADLTKLVCSSEYIHTRHLGYDLYDPSDWARYIVIEKVA